MAWGGLPHPGNKGCCTHFPAVTLQRRVQPSAMSDHAHPSRQIGAPRGAPRGRWDSDLHSLGLHLCTLWLFVGVVGVCVCVRACVRVCATTGDTVVKLEPVVLPAPDTRHTQYWRPPTTV